MNVAWYKFIAFVSLLLLLPLCAALPFLIANKVSRTARERFLSLANAFAGGIFLAGGFVHLLTDATKEFAELLGDGEHLPIAMILAPIGLLFAFFVEKILLPHPAHGHSAPKQSAAHPQNDPDGSGLLVAEKKAEQQLEVREEDAPHKSTADEPSVALETGPPMEQHTQKELLPYLLAFVLSIHSVVGGMALGIQSTVSGVTTIFVAIISHKWIEAFALGASILKNSATLTSFLKIIIFYTLTTPTGILIGALLEALVKGDPGSMITAILTALAAGSFIYVAIVDILVEEFADPSMKWWKLLLCILGLAFNTGLTIAFEE